MKKEKKMFKAAISAFFLSCVAAAAPAYAKGDVNAGYNRAGNSGIYHDCCASFPDGGCVFSGGKVLCSSDFMRDRLVKRKGDKLYERKHPPVPYLVDMSKLLDKTRWSYNDVYFMPRGIKKEDTSLKVLSVYGVPAALAIGAILIIFAAFNDWGPKEDEDKEEPI